MVDVGLAELVLPILAIAISIIGYFVKSLVSDHNELKKSHSNLERKVAVQEAIIQAQDSTIQEVKADVKTLIQAISEIKTQLARIYRSPAS